MGAIAKGKVNASEVQVGQRIIVNTNGSAYPWVEGTSISPSRTKTGENVVVTTVTDKMKARGARGYVIVTGQGSFYAEPIQTMWLAPEDAAGIKRAHVEAIEEQGARWKLGQDEIWDEALAEDAEREAATEINPDDLPDPDGSNTLPIPAGPWFDPEAGASAPDANRHESQTGGAEDLTLNSHGGKVDNNSKDEPEGDEMTTETAPAKRHTGSAVVIMMEKVWTRIRENHPELPDVVIVTGSGSGSDGLTWGHFRADGWKVVQEEGAAIHLNEMFMAGETMAKGARQVLQTMLHEGAHALARLREIQDTSRQHRWHNAKFRTLAEEMGLEYKATKADDKIGFSAVTLTEETLKEYADLLAELDKEISLVVSLPGWLSGGLLGGLGGLGDPLGGDGVKGRPAAPTTPNSNNLKLTCGCAEPNIIRASRKVADKMVVNCGDCDEAFRER